MHNPTPSTWLQSLYTRRPHFSGWKESGKVEEKADCCKSRKQPRSLVVHFATSILVAFVHDGQDTTSYYLVSTTPSVKSLIRRHHTPYTPSSSIHIAHYSKDLTQSLPIGIVAHHYEVYAGIPFRHLPLPCHLGTSALTCMKQSFLLRFFFNPICAVPVFRVPHRVILLLTLCHPRRWMIK